MEMNEETLKTRVQSVFPDKADKVIAAAKEVYPSASDSTLVRDRGQFGPRVGVAPGAAKGGARWRAGVLLSVRMADTGAQRAAHGVSLFGNRIRVR